MPVQAATLAAHHGGPRPDGAVAHRLGQDRRVRHPVRERHRQRRGQVRAGASSCCRRASWRCRSPPSWRKICAVPAASRSCPVYGGAPMGKQIEQLRAGGQIVVRHAGPRARSPAARHAEARSRALRRARRVRRDAVDGLPGGHRDDPRAARRTTRQTLLFSATMPEGIQRLARRFLRNARVPEAVGATTSACTRSSTSTTRSRASSASSELLRILDFEEPKSAIIFCNTREETGARRRVPAQARATTPRRSRRICRRAIASACMGRMRAGRHQVPGRDRRRGARHRHREPVARLQLHVPRGARDLHPPHRPHRSRRQQGDGDLADRPHRGRVVLLPEAALQDQTGGALAAVGGGDPLAPRGRARAGAARGRWRAIRAPSGARWRAGW